MGVEVSQRAVLADDDWFYIFAYRGGLYILRGVANLVAISQTQKRLNLANLSKKFIEQALLWRDYLRRRAVYAVIDGFAVFRRVVFEQISL